MKRTFFRICLSLLFLTLFLPPSELAGAQPGHFSANQTALGLIEEVNALRESQGLPPYVVDPILMTVAQTHAEYLAEKGILTHFSADGRRPYQRALDAGYPVAGDLSLGGVFAENILSGAGLTSTDAVRAWQGHPTNSDVMLSTGYMDVGAGEIVVKGVTYFVLDVGTADSSITRTPASPTLPVETRTGTPIFINTALPNGEIFHTVKKDEALWSIAIAYGITIEELKRLNGLATDEIFEGQTLLVQRASTPTLTPSPVITATFGIPTSTPTMPVTPTATPTSTPIPTSPVSLGNGGMVVGLIVLVALAAAGVGSLLGRKKDQ